MENEPTLTTPPPFTGLLVSQRTHTHPCQLWYQMQLEKRHINICGRVANNRW